MGICWSCFKEYGDEFEVCPYCGTIKDERPNEPIHLIPGTILAQRYYIGKSVGAGGFGIIYKAWDSKLDTIVAVKEFFVSQLMTRAVGQKEIIANKTFYQDFEYRKARFLAEARTMARFGTHRSIPNVFEFFEENGTAYIVMELLTGEVLKDFINENGGKIDKDFAIMIAHEVGNALISLHECGIIHRDVAPDNIFICSGSEIKIKLLDLGAAKLPDSSDDINDIILKKGYSPVEQYNNTKNIGPWTDIYALGATVYDMLTGIRPDESTDRKIEDTVLYPSEIDNSISNNLSNAVMKAMAIEKHMRFGSVVEFLEAIDGERKVLPVNKEKKRRFRRRLLGIVAACAALVLAFLGVLQIYKDKRSVQYLNDADISLWFCAEDDSDEKNAVQDVINDFCNIYPNISVEVQSYPEETYYEKLFEASQKGQLPSLFESGMASKELLAEASDVTEVLESEQAESCLFLDRYAEAYPDKKQVPLGIEVPIAYVITSGNTSIEYSENTFSDIDDFGKDVLIAYDDDYGNLIKENFPEAKGVDKSLFFDNSENKCAVLISSSMALNKVRNELTNYEKKYVYYAGDDVTASYTYEWSLGKGTPDEKAAAERLLSWMLGNNYQNILMISRCSDGQIPINGECFAKKTESKYYSSLNDIYGRYRVK